MAGTQKLAKGVCVCVFMMKSSFEVDLVLTFFPAAMKSGRMQLDTIGLFRVMDEPENSNLDCEFAPRFAEPNPKLGFRV